MLEAISTPGAMPNCISFALYRVGLSESDKRGFTPPLEDLLEKTAEVEPEKADLLAVVHNQTNSIIHLAAMDRDRPGYVVERAGTGENPVPKTVEEALAPYRDESGTNRFLYLEVRKDD